MGIVFELPTKRHELMAKQFKEEFFAHNEQIINGSALLDQMDYEEWINNMERNNNPATVRNDWVVATTFFALRKSDNNILEMIDIRHRMGN